MRRATRASTGPVEGLCAAPTEGTESRGHGRQEWRPSRIVGGAGGAGGAGMKVSVALWPISAMRPITHPNAGYAQGLSTGFCVGN